MKDHYEVIIIGSGIGGLVCGCYLARQGVKALILEQSQSPGGCCTSFERDGCCFDVGAHYLGGVNKGYLSVVLDDLDLRGSLRLDRFDPAEIVSLPGRRVFIRGDIEDTKREFCRNFPAEKDNIRRFFDYFDGTGLSELFRRTYGLTFEDVLDSYFSDRDLKLVFDGLGFCNKGAAARELAAISGIILLKQYVFDPGYYPEGGMKSFPAALCDTFTRNGGEIVFGSRVNKIITERGAVTGVQIEGGRTVFAKRVVSNTDATKTFCEFLDMDSKEKKKIPGLIPASAFFSVFLSLDRAQELADAVKVPSAYHIFTHKLAPLDREDVLGPDNLRMLLCSLTAHACPSTGIGVEILTVVERMPGDFWRDNKKVFAETIVSRMLSIYPEFRNKIKNTIVISPADYERVSSNSGGAAFGWACNQKQVGAGLVPVRTSVKGLYMVGHWATMGMGQGGVPGVARCGQRAAGIISSELSVSSGRDNSLYAV